MSETTINLTTLDIHEFKDQFRQVHANYWLERQSGRDAKRRAAATAEYQRYVAERERRRELARPIQLNPFEAFRLHLEQTDKIS